VFLSRVNLRLLCILAFRSFFCRMQHLYHASPAPSSASSLSSASSSCAAASPPVLLSISGNNGQQQQSTSASASSSNGTMDHGPASNGFDADGSGMGGYHHAHHAQHQQQHHYSSPSPMLSHSQHQQQGPHQFSNGLIALGSSASSNPPPPSHHSHHPLHQQQQQPMHTPTSMSSFFNSFGSGSGNSPPPLTPNGLLSGLHSFLFADSNLGLDSFVDCSLGGPGGLIGEGLGGMPSVNSYLLPGPLGPSSQAAQAVGVSLSVGGGQSSGGSASSSPVTLAGLNPASAPTSAGGPNNIRLPPFCTI